MRRPVTRRRLENALVIALLSLGCWGLILWAVMSLMN